MNIKINAPNDFGRVIDTLFFSGPLPNFSDIYGEEVKKIANIEGFTFESPVDVYPVRDFMMMLNRHTFIYPYASINSKEAIERCGRKAIYRKDHTSFIAPYRERKGALLGNVVTKGRGIVEKLVTNQAGLPPSVKVAPSHLFFEGGNAFTLTAPDGKKRVLLGEDSLTITHMMMRMDGFFKAVDPSSRLYLKETTIAKHSNNAISQLYLSGDIVKKIAELAKTIILTQKEAEETSSEMDAMGLIKSFSLETEKDKDKAKEITVEYLAQAKFLREVVIPGELQVEPSQVIYVPQIEYHLDCMMTSGPNGTVLLQDYELAVRLLKEVEKDVNDPKDRELLDKMLEATKHEGQVVRHVFQKAKERLEQGGLKVISTPGAFVAAEGNTIQQVNFFNAVSGYSPKTKHHYYIVGGTSIGKNLGRLLMEKYAQFLKSLSTVEVYYIGKNPQNPADFSISDRIIREHQLGVHCLCLETKIVEDL